MKKYVYRITFNKDRKEYDVTEVLTDNVIKTTSAYKSALKTVRFLENGGGFEGFTPNFMTTLGDGQQ